MVSAISRAINSIDRWTMPVTKGMPAIATLGGAMFLTRSIVNNEGKNKMAVGIIGTSLGAISLYSPRVGRLASSIALLSVAILAGIHKN